MEIHCNSLCLRWINKTLLLLYIYIFLVLRWPRRKPVITFVRDFLRQKVQFAVRIYNIAFRSRFPIIGMFSIVDFLD